MRKIRYRDNSLGSSKISLERAKKHLGRLGSVTEIRGYRYTTIRSAKDPSMPFQGQYEAMMVVGPKGSMRFSGVSWGYSGYGPRAAIQILMACGLTEAAAMAVAFGTERKSDDGVDFTIKFSTPVPIDVDRITVC